jgi:gliding motility-associated-like protein
MKKNYCLLLFFSFFYYTSYSQSSLCSNADPFCAGGGLTFGNTVGSTPAEAGIDYDCLGTQPNPAWFYLQIAEAGDLSFLISQETLGGNPIDVDYIAWGPFSAPSCGPANLNATTQLPAPDGCSYSAAAIENFTIYNAQVGEYYMLLMTNFSNQAGEITLTQTNNTLPGAGSTDCSIVCPLSVLGGDSPPCPQAILTAVFQNASNPSFQWYNGVNPISGATSASYVATTPGTYTVVANSPGCYADASASANVPPASPAPITQPPLNLDGCGVSSAAFDLTINDLVSMGLDPNTYSISYHTSLADAQLGVAPIGNPASYTGSSGETIYISIQESCITTQQFTLSVSQLVLPTQANVTACDTYTLPPLSAESTYHSASGGASPLTSTTFNTPGVTTVWIYTQSATNPDCEGETSFTVTINATPATPVQADIAACDTYTLPALPTGSTYNTASGGTTPMGATPVITGEGIHTIWIFAQSGSTPNCTAESSFTVTITDTPVIPDPADVVACNSYTLPALFNGNYFSQSGGTGTQYFAGDVITAGITLYVYAQSGTTPNCFAQNSFDIGIFASPAINTNVTPLEICDDNNDGFQCGIDLTSKSAEITGGAPNLVASFYETDTDAQNGVTAIPNPSSYCSIEMGIQTIYVRVTDVLAPLCASFTSFEIRVNPVPVANAQITDYALCDVTNPGDGVEVFDLTSKNAEILGVQTGITVTYYESLDDALVPVNAIPNPASYTNLLPSPQEIWVRLENAATGCWGTGSFNLVVNPLPAVTPPLAMNACSDGLTGTASFNLSSNDLFISGGIPGMVVSYYLSLADAQGEVSALPNPYSSGTATIFVRVENASTGCFDTTTLDLIVTQGPAANTPTPLQVCDPNNDCFAGFDLTDSYGDIVGLPVPAGVTVTFHETITDAQNGVNAVVTNYTNIVACDQILFVRVSYVATGCYNIVELALHVNSTPQGTVIDPLEVCDDNTDGIGTFDLTTATAPILGSLDPALHTVTYYTLEANAQAGTNPITNVLGFSSASQCIWVRIEDNLTGCFDIIQLCLIVNPLPLGPVSGAVSPYTLCDVDAPGDEQQEFDLCSKIPEILNGQVGMEVTFHQSQAEAFGDTGALDCLYVNGPNAQTLHVRIENVDTGCFVLTTMDLRVEPLPSPIPPSGPVVECDQDGDGFAEFDLDALVAAMLQGEPNTAISFHLTELDAANGNNAIADPAHYTNDDAFVDYVYVRDVNNVTGCSSVIMIELNVTASPVAPALDDITKCDLDANTQDGQTNFDLTIYEPLILSAQLLPLDPGGYDITYYNSQAEADLGTSPLIPATSYINNGSPQTIYVRVEGVESECYNTTSFDIIVNAPLALVTPTPLALCDDGPTTVPVAQTVFDLTVKNNEITGGLPGYTVDYYLTQADALAGTNPIPDYTAYTNTANAQTLFVAVTGSPALCRSFTTHTIRVLPLPVPVSADIPALVTCDDNLPQGSEIYDLTTNEDLIRDNDPTLVFEYYESQADAESQTGMIADPTQYVGGSITIWIRVMKNTGTDYLGDFCYVLVQQQVILNPLPVVPALPVTYRICDAANSGVATFVLDSMDDDLLAADPLQDPADFTITYHLTPADAVTGANPLANLYENILNPQTIYAHVVNNATGCVNPSGAVTLSVEAGATATIPTPYQVCDTDTDGSLTIDLNTLFDATVLGTQTAPLFTIAYYPTEADALAGTNVIATPAAFTTLSTTVYGVVTNATTLCPSTPAAISITVEPLADPVITSDTGGDTICVDFTSGTLNSGLVLDSGVSGTGYTFQWYHDTVLTTETGPTYNVIDPLTGAGNYTVVATSTFGCVSAASAPFTVLQSGPAEIPPGTVGYTLSNAFSDVQTITVSIQGYGAGFYQYQLDQGPIVDNGGVFVDVGPGTHTVTVYDFEGNDFDLRCQADLVIQDIQMINYPHFFTPNGDGINDHWNIVGLDGMDTVKIYIFDRYGKLLKQISPSSPGWDGTYNGQPMPSTDYWFSVYYPETGVSKEFKAHFSLKR